MLSLPDNVEDDMRDALLASLRHAILSRLPEEAQVELALVLSQDEHDMREARQQAQDLLSQAKLERALAKSRKEFVEDQEELWKEAVGMHGAAGPSGLKRARPHDAFSHSDSDS